MYPRLYIGDFSISTYLIMFLVGMCLMIVLNLVRRKRAGLSIAGSAGLTVLVTLLSLIGAKLLYALESLPDFHIELRSVEGVSFFGSVFFLPAALYLLCRLTKKPYGILMDTISPALMVMLATLRVGCFLNGCCGGILYHTSAGLQKQVPTQAMEACGDLLIMFLLLYVEWWYGNLGLLYPVIMVTYGALRFLIEFLRDTPKNWLFLSHGQWFAAISFAVGLCLLLKLKKDKKKELAAANRKRRGKSR